MRRFRAIAAALAGAVAAVLLVGHSGLAQDEPKPKTDYGEIHRKLDQRPEIWTRWDQCPADIFRENRAMLSYLMSSRDYDLAECEEDAGACFTACFDGRNEHACFELARALQENTEREYSRYWEAMFAQSCATGSDGGCTNRGAGIVNGNYADDPFGKKSPEESATCGFRSFEVSCGAGDAWGCTMLGWEYKSGEATARDVEKAKAAFTKSCAINDNFVACDYARDELKGFEDAGG